jgi:Predicted membrane protein
MSILSRTLRTDPTTAAPLVLRLALGSVFVAHGGQKLFGWWGGHGFDNTAKFFESQLGLSPGWLHASLAGGGEFFGGLLLLFGLLTRFAAAQAAVIMAVAIWTVHRSAFFSDKGGMEFPLTLLLIAVALALTGGGALSVDAHLAASKPASKNGK